MSDCGSPCATTSKLPALIYSHREPSISKMDAYHRNSAMTMTADIASCREAFEQAMFVLSPLGTSSCLRLNSGGIRLALDVMPNPFLASCNTIEIDCRARSQYYYYYNIYSPELTNSSTEQWHGRGKSCTTSRVRMWEGGRDS